jgi:transcriptional regulator, AsnC family
MKNARETTEDIARQTGLDTETVDEAITELEDEETIRGYQAVVDRNQAGAGVRAIVELNIGLDQETGYEEVAQRIAKFPTVDALHLVSGDFDLAVVVSGDSMQDVSQFVSEQVAPMSPVTQTVSHYMMQTYKQGGIIFDHRDDDDRLSVSP